MTNRPYLTAFALAVAGMWCSAIILAGILFGWPVVKVLAAAGTFGLFAIAYVLWGNIGTLYDQLDNQTRLSQEAQRLENERRAFALELQRQPAIPASADDANESAWYPALRAFFHNGHRAGGFSHTRLVLSGTMTEPAWEWLCRYYCGVPGRRVLRLDSRDGYVWGYQASGAPWTWADVEPLIVAHTLPHPTGKPPQVQPWVHDTTTPPPRRQKTTVIEGTVREGGHAQAAD